MLVVIKYSGFWGSSNQALISGGWEGLLKLENDKMEILQTRSSDLLGNYCL
jgi:hypothetical protein